MSSSLGMSSSLRAGTHPATTMSSALSGSPTSTPPTATNTSAPLTRATASMSSMDRSNASTRSGPGSHRTLKLLRTIVGQRNADYCAETSQPTHGGNARNAVPAGGAPSTRSLLNSNRSIEPLGSRQRWWAGLCLPADRRRSVIGRILASPYYKALLVVLTIILLFGAQIRFIFIPSAGDATCDGIFMTTFVIFWIDIFMRIDAEPHYFPISVCGLRWHRNNNQQQLRGGTASTTGFCCTSWEVGSFLFWCDALSTLALLQEITFIDTDNFAPIWIVIILDSFGVPAEGLDSINVASPVKPEVSLLVSIAKSLRCTRFIRSSTAIKISSKVNWNAMINAIDPFWWWNQISPKLSNLPCLRGKEGSGTGSNEFDYTTGRSASLKGGGGGPGGGPGGSLPGSKGAGAAGPGSKASPSAPPMRRTSWGGVGLSALAAVRAERLRRSQEDHLAEARGPASGLVAYSKRALRFLGLRRIDRDELARHVAATKIQRAWRHAYYKQEVFESHSSLGIAWKARQPHTRTNTDNPIERVLQTRSFLKRYSTMNMRNTRNVKSQSRRIPLGVSSAVVAGSSSNGSTAAKRRNESQVGTAMRELTGQRVAIGIILALVLTVLFTYTEQDSTRPSAMIVLHNQTGNGDFASRALTAARGSAIPDLFQYWLANGSVWNYSVTEVAGNPSVTLRPRETYIVNVTSPSGTTLGFFAYRNERVQQAWVSIFSTIFIILIWFFGVTAFAGPVMVLVVIPIERMVRLLGMIMVDPLGYENTARYKRFMEEEDAITKNTRWTKEVLKGMETSFLMSTILRIGSLMKVGFGSAGVEIIRNNLEKGQSKNMLMLSSQGSSVSCIFLFCDIRQFTDATECLQEEVFVFTNRIAAVVHSICHSYGGSANKNIGDAFLLSWLLEEQEPSGGGGYNGLRSSIGDESYTAKYNQADKALLSVVKICMALHYDDFYVQGMSDAAREALMTKLAKRKGPIVQMGFGLHAGKAVQGAIGSQRKIDATYVSEHVERAEFLESSTKKYGVKMLMSDSFHRLLHPGNRRRCRKIDQILIQDEDDAEDDYLSGDGKIIELLTFDMDIDALWRVKGSDKKGGRGDPGHESDSEMGSEKGFKKDVAGRLSSGMLRRLSVARTKDGGSDEFSEAFPPPVVASPVEMKKDGETGPPSELVLPTGPALYNANVWVSEDMRRIRQKYSDGLFFQKFNSGLQAFYARDWEHARQCFVTVLDLFEDGPSRYFLNQIEKNNGIPPRDFKGYGIA